MFLSTLVQGLGLSLGSAAVTTTDSVSTLTPPDSGCGVIRSVHHPVVFTGGVRRVRGKRCEARAAEGLLVRMGDVGLTWLA